MESEKEPQRHKGGRPKKLVKRESVTGIRFNNLEYYIIKSKATKADLPITTYIRQIAVNGKVIARMSDEERQFVRDLTGIANNFNQLTKIAHKEGLMSIIMMLENYKIKVDKFLEWFLQRKLNDQ